MFASKRVPAVAALLAIVLALPSAFVGLAGDDYYHRALILGLGDLSGKSPILDMFAFLPGGESNARFLELGLMPWWSDPGIRAAFFRPISAATHVLDYALWPDSPLLQHAHSLLWMGLGTYIVARVYRAMPVAPVAAGAAALMFAVEDAHAVTAGWIANRNALLCLVFGGLALLAHLRSHRDGDRRWLAAGVAGIAVGLLCGEATLGALAYIAAFQLTMVGGPLLKRLLPLVPYGALVVVWRLAYNYLGYGASGSGLYIDPGRQPLDFAGALVERWPLMVSAQWFQLPSDIWMLAPRGFQVGMVAFSMASVVGLAAWLWPVLRQRPEARMWALGMALSVIPLCAAFPMARLLLFPGIGAFGLLGVLVAHPPAGWRRTVSGIMVIVHGPLSAVMLFAMSFSIIVFGLAFSTGARHAPTHPELADQSLVFVNNSELIGAYTGIMRSVEPQWGPPPRRIAQLSALTTSSTVTREDDDTLVVVPDGGLLRGSLEQLFWGTGHRFAAGEVVASNDFDAEIRAVTDDGRPAVIAYHFREPLESAAYCFVYWTDDGLEPFPLPAAGEGITLPVTVPAL